MDNERLKISQDAYRSLYNAEWVIEERPGDPPNGVDLAQMLFEHCYADSWARPNSLDPKVKELVTLSAMVSMGGLNDEFRMHIVGALLVGVTKSEIVELLIHLGGYVGVARTVGAWRAARKVFAEHPDAS